MLFNSLSWVILHQCLGWKNGLQAIPFALSPYNTYAWFINSSSCEVGYNAILSVLWSYTDITLVHTNGINSLPRFDFVSTLLFESEYCLQSCGSLIVLCND